MPTLRYGAGPIELGDIWDIACTGERIGNDRPNR